MEPLHHIHDIKIGRAAKQKADGRVFMWSVQDIRTGFLRWFFPALKTSEYGSRKSDREPSTAWTAFYSPFRVALDPALNMTGTILAQLFILMSFAVHIVDVTSRTQSQKANDTIIRDPLHRGIITSSSFKTSMVCQLFLNKAELASFYNGSWLISGTSLCTLIGIQARHVGFT